MRTPSVDAQDVRRDLLTRTEIALIDLRDENSFAGGHPLFAAQLPPERIAVEAPYRLPRQGARIVLYDDGEGLVEPAAEMLRRAGHTRVEQLRGGLRGWRDAGYELFRDVNSYCKAFGELVEQRRQTPSLPAETVRTLIDSGANMVVLDVRRFDEYRTMSIPGGISVPGAELVLRARALAPDPDTSIIVNCAGRTRGLIGAQSLINAGVPNPVHALRNGTIGWTLAGQALEHGQARRFPDTVAEPSLARAAAADVAYRAGVRHIDRAGLHWLSLDADRTLYRLDVRTPEEFARGHLPGFVSAPGGQLVQETDHFAPVRGARIVLADDFGPRATMTASWLAQMAWEVYVLDDALTGGLVRTPPPPPRGAGGRYRRPYEGTDNPAAAMQAYLDWEYGLTAQLAADRTHGFFVI